MGRQRKGHVRTQRQVCAEALERRCLLSAALVHGGVDASATAILGNTLFFLNSNAGQDTTLWKTDGTSAGTAIVKDFTAANSDILPWSLKVAGSRVYFVTENQSDHVEQLWRSDGTAAGTTSIYSTKNLVQPQFSILTPVGDKLYFVVRQRGATYTTLDQLFWTDATTSTIQSITAGPFGTKVDLTQTFSDTFVINTLTAARGKLIAVVAYDLYAYDDGGIWETDGTNAGVKKVASSGFHVDFIAGTPDQLFYSDGKLWSYSGSTPAQVIGVSGSDVVLGDYLQVNGHLFFEDFTHHRILSVAEDTHTVSWIPDDENLTTWDELPSAIAKDGIAYYLHKGTLWGTDGTAAGTKARGGVVTADSYSYLARLIGIAQNAFYYEAYSDALGGNAILTTDGPNGAPRILNIPIVAEDSKLINVGTSLYYFSPGGEYAGAIDLCRFQPGLGTVKGKVTLTSATPWFGLSGYRVYIDSNNNGKRDSGEASALTSRTGHFTIDGVAAGKVAVRVEALAAGQPMTTPDVQTVTLAGDDFASVTFGFATDPRPEVMAGSVSGTVTLDSATPAFPLSGYTVFVDANNNQMLDSGEPKAVTDAAGNYSLPGVTPGTVLVGIQKAAASQQLITPQFQTTTLAPRGSTSVHFGVASDPRADVVAGTLGGKVFLNSAFGKLPLSGYRVFVDSNQNGVLDSGEPNAISSSKGRYSISGVVPGTPSVRVEKLSADQKMTTPIMQAVALAPRGAASADFGFATDPRSARISGMVSDSGTAPAAGVTVYIDLNDNGVVDDADRSVTTAADGTYTFVGLPVNSYSIKFIPPAQTTAGSTDAAPVIALPGRSNTGPNFSFTHNATVSGLLFKDINGNGARDAGEPGIGGVRVRLQFVNDDLEYVSVYYQAAVRTRSSGRYEFSIPSGYVTSELRVAPDLSLDAGQRYSVGVVDAMETSHSTGAICGCFQSGGYYPPRIDPNETIARNYGITSEPSPPTTGSITGTVFNDLNTNQIRDAGEGTLAKQHVWLDLDRDGSYDADEPIVLSNSRGAFTFPELAAGSYLVHVDPSAGVRSVGASTQEIDCLSGKTAQFAFTTNGLIAGTVYMDANKNGTIDAAESGMGGWTVFIDADGDGIFDAGETIAITDAAGKFAISAPNGSYRVRAVPQGRYRQTSPGAGYRSLSVSAGQIAAKVNFGEKRVS